jgi:hypothetical protein
VGTHTFGDLCLRKSRVVPRLQKLIKEFAFLALDTIDFLPYAWAAKQLRYNLLMSSHP